MTDEHATVARFDRWAPDYNDSALQILLYARVHAAVLDRCARVVPAPRRLLDVGCGTGRLLHAAALHFPGAAMVGVDISGGMLAVATASVPARGLFVRAAVERLPFADAGFDLVTATLTYRHWVDQTAGLREIGRVLDPGGVFGLAGLVVPLPSGPGVLRRGGRARVPEPLSTSVRSAGLRPISFEFIAGTGPIAEISVLLATRAIAM